MPWSWQRRREADVVALLMGNIRGLYALDLGCGAGFYTRMLLSSGARHVTSVDISPAMVSQLPTERVTGVVGDVATVQLDNKFNIITIAGMLEFSPDPQKVLENARTHATNAGVMIVLVPVIGFWGTIYRFYHKLHGFNIHLFDVAQMKAMAERAKWKAIEVRKLYPFTLIMKFEAH